MLSFCGRFLTLASTSLVFNAIGVVSAPAPVPETAMGATDLGGASISICGLGTGESTEAAFMVAFAFADLASASVSAETVNCIAPTAGRVRR